ncbi:hypothetical protein C8J56DRAFT_371487 [Mycena floridula]|nr:hypothetical protein C8J56DRAFT_371487 [Mycena floridula]
MIGSPSTYLLWTVLASISFLFIHLWLYDRFQCIKWDSGRQPGAFKRVMTYSYLATVPLLLLFSAATTVIKYKEGFIYDEATRTVYSTPLQLWSPVHQRWVLPLYFILSFSWAFEIMTHLEELTFWLFLLHQGPSQRSWFQSCEFRVWYMGSMIAFLGMPLTVLIRRNDLETCLAWIFLAGSSAGSITTLCSTYVIARFPRFIRQVKAEGASPDVLVRLATFYQLNLVRIVFRVFFNLPMLIVGVDGVHGNHSIVLSPFWPDFLLMCGGIGCLVSSSITLLIFFPRSITQESGFHARIASKTSAPEYQTPPAADNIQSPKSPDGQPVQRHYSETLDAFRYPAEPTPVYESDPENDLNKAGPEMAEESLHHRNWRDSHSPYPYQFPVQVLEEEATSSRLSVVHPYVMTFTSPIDLLDLPDAGSEVQAGQPHRVV